MLFRSAAVEAATAGEAGKGFAVVAQEVRNLASRSAEAANEIKNLVESAANKAQAGKDISNNMIDGYESLSVKIDDTKNIIDIVSNASIEQSRGIKQINDTVATIDANTQEIARESSSIDGLATEVQDLSRRLLSVSDHVQYREETKQQVCDIDMVYHLNKIQLGHIKFKDTNFARLSEKTHFKVVDHNSCALGKWIHQMEEEGKAFTKSAVWSDMKVHHEKVHGGVQKFVDDNADGADSAELVPLAHNVEESINFVFQSLNDVKIENCKNKV